jgi:hypothetical protein
MGWSGSAYYFCKLTHAFTNYLRRLAKPPIARTATSHKPSRSILRNIRWRGIRLAPYMDDFMCMAHSREATLLLRDRVEALLHRLGLQRNPKKGLWEPTHLGDHLGLTIDLQNCEFRSSPRRQTADPLQTCVSLTRPRSEHRPLATRKTASRVRMEGAAPLPSHRATTFLPPRTPLRDEYASEMGRPSPYGTPTKARPRMVADSSARPAQWTLNLQTHRDGVPPR